MDYHNFFMIAGIGATLIVVAVIAFTVGKEEGADIFRDMLQSAQHAKAAADAEIKELRQRLFATEDELVKAQKELVRYETAED